ncbi:MAG: c-type cytochrome [Candidatus Binatus sp.]|uniref:c-type cytochrome n=1 Tax=Candidatus Binatus sp. TaxID=2811406 RepID=UPI002719A66F|nr:c-type cytochrome [Candidatus Binatus sp.]MDO8435030.1 c-type cytochrome [Candidatus Binatus sp.]
MKRVFWLLFAIAVTSLASQSALAEDKDVADGQRYFARYCASCHGKDGAGDGPVAKALSKPPANLRMLGDKYGLPLPAPRIAKFIDGRDAVRAHGTRDMPVWGEQLYALGHGEQGELGIGEVVGKIIAYLNTIQDRRTASRLGTAVRSGH